MINDFNWRFKRLQQQVRRSWGSLALRGWRGTLKRALLEFRPQRREKAADLFGELFRDTTAFSFTHSSEPAVSIIVPAVGVSAEKVELVLRSIALGKVSLPFEVIVIEHPHESGHCDIDKFGARRLCLSKENNVPDISTLVRAGAQAAHAKYLVVLDYEVVLAPHCVDSLFDCISNEPDCLIAAARTIDASGRSVPSNLQALPNSSECEFDNDVAWRMTRRRVDVLHSPVAIFHSDFILQKEHLPSGYRTTALLVADLSLQMRNDPRGSFYAPSARAKWLDDRDATSSQFAALDRSVFDKKWLTIFDGACYTNNGDSLSSKHYPDRILVVETMLPNPERDSGSLRLCMMLRLLHQDGWRVDLISDDGFSDDASVERLGDYGISVQRSNVANFLRAHGATLHATILCRLPIAAQYLALVKQLAPHALRIFDTVDLHFVREQRAAEISGSRRMLRQAEASRRQELSSIKASDLTWVVSDIELTLLGELLPDSRVELLSNIHPVHGRGAPFAERRDLIFIGGFRHPPNADAVRWFVANVLPLILLKEPLLKLHLIGDISLEEKLELAQESIEIHGRVDKLDAMLNACRISVAPLRFGAGVKGKVNMVMSHGIPVVATSVAAEGMHLSDGMDVLIADNADDFAAAVVRLYRDETLWTALSDAGVRNVEAHFSIDGARRVLAKTLPSSISANKAASANARQTQ